MTDNDFKKAIQEGIRKVNIFTDINVATVEAQQNQFTDVNKGITDLIPAAVETVKQEIMKQMQLFGSIKSRSINKKEFQSHGENGILF